MAVINSVSFQEEMKRNATMRKENVQVLKEWRRKQIHLPAIWDSDFALFLHSNYQCLESTKLCIDNYFFMRSQLPEFFSNRYPVLPSELQLLFDKISIISLEKCTRGDCKVILVRLLDPYLNDQMYKDAVKTVCMILDLCLYLEGTQKGFIFVFDVNGANIKNASDSGKAILMKFFQYLQKAAPIRWHGLHYIDTTLTHNSIGNYVRLKIFKSKHVGAIYFHSNLDSLNEIVSLDALPNEMGGCAGSLADLQIQQIKKLETYNMWFYTMDLFGNLRSDAKCSVATKAMTLEKEFEALAKCA